MRWFRWGGKTTKSEETSLKLLRRGNDEGVIELTEQTLDSGLPVKEMQAIVRNIIDLHGSKSVIDRASIILEFCQKENVSLENSRNFYTATTRALSFYNNQEAIDFGEKYLTYFNDVRTVHSLVKFYLHTENIERPLELLEQLKIDDWHIETKTILEERLFLKKLEGEYKEELASLISLDDKEIKAFVSMLKDKTKDEIKAYRLAYQLLIEDFKKTKRHSQLIIEYGEKILTKFKSSIYIRRQVSDAHIYRGNITKALKILEEHPDQQIDFVKLKKQSISELLELYTNGFTHKFKKMDNKYETKSEKIFYLLHNSLPYDSGGYATRTHGILSQIKRRGWEIQGVTRLGYPNDREKHKEVKWKESSLIDDVLYKRIKKGNIGHGKLPLNQYLHENVNMIYDYAVQEKPRIIHAASNFMNGLAANFVSNALGIHSIYEVRGLWEITRISRQPYWKNSEYYEMMWRLEAQAANEADTVICITEALKDEMISRGVDKEKIRVVPNGVDINRFVPRDKDKKLENELKLDGKKVIGYVGSIVQYEGLDYLLEALAILKKRGITNLALLIVGDGDKLEDIKALSSKLELDDITTFTGRVPHEKVTNYYSLIDIAPFPRKSLPVTEMVSPLKPFEAMALNKIILASDVAALKEIIDNGVNGFLFKKDNVNDLANNLELLIKKPDLGKKFNPRGWVQENRNWEYVTNELEDIYLRLTAVPLEKIKLSSGILDILEKYKEKYQQEKPNFLRRDDYARWSHVEGLLKSRGSLLDVGIGIGQFINTLAAKESFSKLYGVDIEPHSSFLRFYDNYSIDYVSISDLHYADNEFDIVTCMETLEHLDDQTFEKGLANLRRVCKEQLIITVPYCEEPLSKFHRQKFDIRKLKTIFPEAKITLLSKGTKQNSAKKVYWCMIEENLKTN